MAKLTDAQIEARIDAAMSRRGPVLEPRARSAYFDILRHEIVVRLTNGEQFTFPPQLAQGLEHATDSQLAEVTVSPSGEGLHWETVDADLSVPGLVEGVFGSKAHMARLGSRGLVPGRPARSRTPSDLRAG